MSRSILRILGNYPKRMTERNRWGNLSVIAFHEKAGPSQVDSSLASRNKVFVFPPSSRCRHAFIRTLEERFVSLGAHWAFTFQPVLLSVWRPVVLLLQSGTWARGLTQSPELGFCLFSSRNDFGFTRLRLLSLGCCCATVRTLLRLPTGDAATPPAFSRSPRWLAFFPPRSASFRPQRRRSQSGPNGPRMCCAPCTNNVRRYGSPCARRAILHYEAGYIFADCPTIRPGSISSPCQRHALLMDSRDCWQSFLVVREARHGIRRHQSAGRSAADQNPGLSPRSSY